MSETDELPGLSASITQFIRQQQRSLFRDYNRALNRNLAQQNVDQLMHRNVLAMQQQFYKELIKVDDVVETDAEMLDKALELFWQDFLQTVIKHHRSSCALSNFPLEHNPDNAYLANLIAALEHNQKIFLQELFSVSA